MSKSVNVSILSAIIATALGLAEATTDEALTMARGTKADERNKDQKLAIIADEIVKAATRFDNVVNDRVPQAKAKAPAYAPEIGDEVLATVGRNTATSQARVVEGSVVAVKHPAEGEKGTTQVRVRIFAGTFDEQLVTLYPAQLVKKPAEASAEA